MLTRRSALLIYWAALACLLPSLATSQSVSSSTAQFKFQDSFWVNLHLFLRAEARRRAYNSSPVLPLSVLSAQEQKAWSSALDAYAELANLNLIFDERLIRISSALAAAGDPVTLPPGVVESEILAALNSAAPVYRAHLWNEHRRANEAWIAKFAPIVQRHAAAISRALATTYKVSWPPQPILVDLSCEAGPHEAYTTTGPQGTAGHTVMAASKLADPDMNLELIFHEASHVVDSHLIEMLNAEAARQHVKSPDELWHVLIFYTTGEIVRRELNKQNDPTYKPYAYRVNLYSTAGWDKMRVALERDWQPYLDGKASLDNAVHDLVRDASQ